MIKSINPSISDVKAVLDPVTYRRGIPRFYMLIQALAFMFKQSHHYAKAQLSLLFFFLYYILSLLQKSCFEQAVFKRLFVFLLYHLILLKSVWFLLQAKILNRINKTADQKAFLPVAVAFFFHSVSKVESVTVVLNHLWSL